MGVKPSALHIGTDADLQTDLVQAELERLCADELFRDTTRMKRFLRFIVEETLDGRGDRLKGYTIGVEVFDRPDDFDPQADTIVRVQAGQLRRRLDLYYSSRGQNSEVRILVPKGRYAPSFELRREVALEAANDLDVLENIPVSDNDPRPSIAVMSLDDLTPDGGEGAFFADGLTAEIVNALVQFRSMRIVTVRPTVSMRGTGVSSTDLGKELDADFVLSGSVRQDDNVFRVTVSLIRCATNEHLFSRVFDREFMPGSLFNLQEDIASYTAAAVAAPFGAVNRYNRSAPSEAGPSYAAYEGVLKYYDIQLSPTRNRAEDLLDRMISITTSHPQYSTGWAVRSLVNSFLVTQCFPVRDPDTHLTEADQCGRKAVKLDCQNAQGYFALYLANYHKGEVDDAQRMINRALTLNPNDYSMLAYHAVCLALQGQDARALAMQTAALRLIGRAPPWFYVPQMIVDYGKADYHAVTAWIPDDFVSAPSCFQLFGLAAKAKLGDLKACRSMLIKLESDFPGYAEEVGKAIAQWHLNPKLYEDLASGLALAGLDILSD